MERNKTFGIDALTLKLLAMAFMLLDHTWATIWSVPWFTMVGRLAFPIFAFQIVEGFYKTSDRSRYTRRMLLFALISEIPFNLMLSDSLVYPFHQNVMFTFLIALLLMGWMERYRAERLKFVGVSVVCGLLASVLGLLTMVDYFGPGVVTVLVFYFFRERKWQNFVLQLLALYWLNVELLSGLAYEVELFGRVWWITQQGFALFALIPIWLYRGRQGHRSRAFRYFCYGFYPVHMLVLGLLKMVM